MGTSRKSFNCTETEKKPMNDAITPFTLGVPQADLEDLNRRIDQTRWPDAETVDDWTQGAPLAKIKRWEEKGSGYFKQQSTRPQTLGYGLADPPVGQAAWIYEKLWAWTDNQGNPEDALTLDEMLDNIMLYWLPGTATSSARLYWESFAIGTASARLEIPVGVSVYPRETLRPSRRWGDRWMPNLIHYNILEQGGHFAAWEQPALHAKEIRACFAKVR
jgi:pimeloyl-ACP methyl ester carboxylesterase